MTSRRTTKQIKSYVEKFNMDCRVVKNEERLKVKDAVAQVIIGDYNLTFWIYGEDAWETVKQKIDDVFKARKRTQETSECPLCFSSEDYQNKAVCTECNNGICSRCHMKMILRASPHVNCSFCRMTQITIRDDAERLRCLESYMAYLVEANGL